MAFKKADDYVEVAERLIEFHKKYPNGRITRKGEIQIVSMPPGVAPEKQRTYVIFTALAYRTPDDLVPAIGTAWEPWPGPTPYTKDSEVQNAETSAWGRAIIAAGIPSKKIASKEEVLARTKPSLEQALDSSTLVDQIKEEFSATELLPDELLQAMASLDIGQKAWVLKKATGKVVRQDAIEKTKLTDDQRQEAIRIATNLAAKKAKAMA